LGGSPVLETVAGTGSACYTADGHFLLTLEVVMAKKRAAKKSAAKKRTKSAPEEQIVLDPDQDKALRLVDKSAKICAELEGAVSQAAAKAVRKVMKDHGISLTPAQTAVLTSIWFSE
jgi:hypothetical protein